ncbi:MAG: hypothetical protein O7I42_05405 [Alphaproteobacteria bacterium]|nr:hypothetical protein [Alphaproteobacteria bacterium]
MNEEIFNADPSGSAGPNLHGIYIRADGKKAIHQSGLVLLIGGDLTEMLEDNAKEESVVGVGIAVVGVIAAVLEINRATLVLEQYPHAP